MGSALYTYFSFPHLLTSVRYLLFLKSCNQINSQTSQENLVNVSFIDFCTNKVNAATPHPVTPKQVVIQRKVMEKGPTKTFHTYKAPFRSYCDYITSTELEH